MSFIKEYLYLIVGILVVLLLIGSHYLTYSYGKQSEVLKAQQTVNKQRDEDAKTLEKMEITNAKLKQKTKKLARAIRESKDSSGCNVRDYPADRRNRMQQSLREIRQGDGSN